MKYLFSLVAFMTLSACSVYQSEGRKFLEKQAFEYTGASAYLQGCSSGKVASGALISSSATTLSYQASEPAFHLSVFSRAQTDFACDFQFSSQSELEELAPAAVELTFLHLGLGQFANRQLNLLK
ncbi:MAG: hypothetical protein AB7F86_12420 [Bdellovibrionales bacterium]